jgi:hypothetical protein
MASSTRPKPSRTSSNLHRNTLSMQRTEITINVYDLLPPGKISSILWAIGSSLLHSGVVIGDKEYAYGGHDRRDVTGVYWTKPGLEPPGGTFKQAILHGFSFRPAEELDAIIQEVYDTVYMKRTQVTCPRPHTSFKGHRIISLRRTVITSHHTSAKSLLAARPRVI